MAPRRKTRVDNHILDNVHTYRVDLDTFTIYLGNEETVIHSDAPESLEPGVEHNMAGRFERNLGILSSIDPTRPILINLASCGGFWEEGMQMFSALLASPNPTTVLAMKDARSMTSIIPLAADRFVLREPTGYMFHHGSWEFSGLTQEATTQLVELLKTQDMMLRLYVARLKEQGQFQKSPPEKIRKMLEGLMERRIDTFLSADEAKKWGFVDDVIDGTHTISRAMERNEERRKRMFRVLSAPVDVSKLLGNLGRQFKPE